jgi:hypothetical protein
MHHTTRHNPTAGDPVNTASATQTPASAIIPALAGTTPYQRAWACWAAGVVGSFAVLETAALLRDPNHGTLSAQLRRKRTLSAAGVALFAAWAVHHIAWQEATR